MNDLIRLTDFKQSEIFEIFKLADRLREGELGTALKGKSAVMFFPNTSIRTRVTFEKGIYLLGGQPILFPTETLDKKESLEDVCGYLNNWADVVIVRHRDIKLIEEMAKYSAVPVINAMTDENHPCEMLADMYSLSKRRSDFTKDKYLFCGRRGNIGLAWKEASQAMGFDFSQCCPSGYEMDGVKVYYDIDEAVRGKDIICTDSLPSAILADFENYRITSRVMDKANDGALLNPCPPFFRGEEVSDEVIASKYFVGYDFKKYLLEIQQAVILYCLMK
ncbi:MAG: peptide transporter [Ruminococcaceae bacterium]|nr:peptide transporter [Oscillospiraceae bacterium]